MDKNKKKKKRKVFYIKYIITKKGRATVPIIKTMEQKNMRNL